ncbi:MAG: hypothetical protein EOM55_02510 [Clostridia bacterium]|nr:hypothetical protein [Clostridia bacterium]
MKGIIVHSFIGSGKTTLGKKYSNVIDLESINDAYILTENQKKLGNEAIKGLKKKKNPNFENIYLEKLLLAQKNFDFILVPYRVLELCRRNNLKYWLVYPSKNCKEEYIQRLRNRGNPEELVKIVESGFEEFIDNRDNDSYAEKKIILNAGEFLENAMKEYL